MSLLKHSKLFSKLPGVVIQSCGGFHNLQIWKCQSGLTAAEIPSNKPIVENQSENKTETKQEQSEQNSQQQTIETSQQLNQEKQQELNQNSNLSEKAEKFDLGEKTSSTNEQGTTQLEFAKRATNIMFPWERDHMDGTPRKMRIWEQWYWILIAIVACVFIFNRVRMWQEVPEEKDPVHEMRMEGARLLLAGREAIVRGQDPFDGFTPFQIQKFIDDSGIDQKDPWLGMEPNEINEFLERVGEIQGQGKAQSTRKDEKK